MNKKKKMKILVCILYKEKNNEKEVCTLLK